MGKNPAGDSRGGMGEQKEPYHTESFSEVFLHFLPSWRLNVVRGLEVFYLTQQGSSGGGHALRQVLAATLILLQALREKKENVLVEEF